ncbi:YitT family protein [bacterium]|nr:YitT family protein [bacterium]
MTQERKEKIFKTVWQLLLIILGALISAVGINFFLKPHHLLSGGVTGTSMLLSYLTPIPTGVWVAILNVPLFAIAWKKIDIKFCIYSLIGMVALAAFIFGLDFLKNFNQVSDPLLSSIFGGMLSGGGAGLVIRARASQGGTDIISIIIRRKFSLSIGVLGFYINIIIVSILALTAGLEPALITLFSQFVGAKALDQVVTGLSTAKSIMIISDKADDISTYIQKTMQRGVTFLDGFGGYSRARKKILWCIVTTSQLSRVKSAMHKIDPEAFMAIVSASEIVGKGFYRNPF